MPNQNNQNNQDNQTTQNHPAPDDDVKTVTIMKYLGSDGDYHFKVLDKFNIADEVERLDYMNDLRDKMLESGEMKQHLWTKSTVLF